ncbi:hypothetical protein D3C71_835900 [compost metagenome]
MRTGDANEDNFLTGPHFANAVDHRDATERPALTRVNHNIRQGFFGHSRIMLQGQRFYAVAEIMIADFAGKSHHSAIFIALGKPAVFRANVKALRPNNNTRVSHD